jgi:hypothetical protein
LTFCFCITDVGDGTGAHINACGSRVALPLADQINPYFSQRHAKVAALRGERP